jgi:hypothetical protein
MARKTKRAAAKIPPETPVEGQALVINPFGETEQRTIKKSKIVDSVITLSDGTKLVIRPVVADIRRAVDQYNQQGQPLYFLTLGHAITTKAPKKNLQKPTPGSKISKRAKP